LFLITTHTDRHKTYPYSCGVTWYNRNITTAPGQIVTLWWEKVRN